MKERPILFNGEMVNAVLQNRKTQTRRVIKPQPPCDEFGLYPTIRGPEMYTPAKETEEGELIPLPDVYGVYDDGGEWGVKCPYGKPGDRLWVREAFGISHRGDSTPAGKPYDPITLFRATDSEPEGYEAGVQWEKFRWRPSIHMPRWASRISLEVTDVRVEQVQDISEEDVAKEGIPVHEQVCGILNEGYKKQDAFQRLWDSINEKRGYGWDVNPWVWVVEFKQIEL